MSDMKELGNDWSIYTCKLCQTVTSGEASYYIVYTVELRYLEHR